MGLKVNNYTKKKHMHTLIIRNKISKMYLENRGERRKSSFFYPTYFLNVDGLIVSNTHMHIIQKKNSGLGHFLLLRKSFIFCYSLFIKHF